MSDTFKTELVHIYFDADGEESYDEIEVEVAYDYDWPEPPSRDCPGSGPCVYIRTVERLDTGEKLTLDADEEERLEDEIVERMEERAEMGRSIRRNPRLAKECGLI